MFGNQSALGNYGNQQQRDGSMGDRLNNYGNPLAGASLIKQSPGGFGNQSMGSGDFGSQNSSNFGNRGNFGQSDGSYGNKSDRDLGGLNQSGNQFERSSFSSRTSGFSSQSESNSSYNRGGQSSGFHQQTQGGFDDHNNRNSRYRQQGEVAEEVSKLWP